MPVSTPFVRFSKILWIAWIAETNENVCKMVSGHRLRRLYRVRHMLKFLPARSL